MIFRRRHLIACRLRLYAGCCSLSLFAAMLMLTPLLRRADARYFQLFRFLAATLTLNERTISHTEMSNDIRDYC